MTRRRAIGPRALIVTAFVVLLALGVAAGIIIRADGDDVERPEREPREDDGGGVPREGTMASPADSITAYLGADETGHLIVPDGTYAGGTNDASRSEWLVLEAETPGGVVVDLSETGLRLGGDTRKVVFVGFRFVNGMVQVAGVDDVHFWYCEFTFPAGQWFEQFEEAGGRAPAERDERSRLISRMANPLPTALRLEPGEDGDRQSTGIGVYGSDLTDVGDDAVYLAYADGVRLEGLRIWDVDEGKFDPGESFGNDGDWFHNDGIQTTGPLRDVTISDSWVGEKIQWAASLGDIERAMFRRLWVAGSSTFGMIAATRGDHRILESHQDRIRAFANGQDGPVRGDDRSAFRVDFVDNREVARWPDQHREPGAFELMASAVLTTTPPGVTVDHRGRITDEAELLEHPENPANRWRDAHPYESWRRYLRLDG